MLQRPVSLPLTGASVFLCKFLSVLLGGREGKASEATHPGLTDILITKRKGP